VSREGVAADYVFGHHRQSIEGTAHVTRHRAQVAELAEKYQLKRFVTLTLDPKRIPPGQRSDRYLRNCWRKMRVSFQRKFGQSLRFISVLEYQKSGMAHLHFLVGVYIPQDWLSEAWQAVGGGMIVDIRYVEVHRVASYVTPYLTGGKIEHTLKLLQGHRWRNDTIGFVSVLRFHRLIQRSASRCALAVRDGSG
jgi:hypothetical protein